MKIVLKSYNLHDANDYLIRHLFKAIKGLTVTQACKELGVSRSYLLKRMKALKILPPTGMISSEQERFFRRLDKAPWNKTIYFTKSAGDTVWKNVEAWRKARGYGKELTYFIAQAKPTSPVELYLQQPKEVKK